MNTLNYSTMLGCSVRRKERRFRHPAVAVRVFVDGPEILAKSSILDKRNPCAVCKGSTDNGSFGSGGNVTAQLSFEPTKWLDFDAAIKDKSTKTSDLNIEAAVRAGGSIRIEVWSVTADEVSTMTFQPALPSNNSVKTTVKATAPPDEESGEEGEHTAEHIRQVIEVDKTRHIKVSAKLTPMKSKVSVTMSVTGWALELVAR